MSQTITRPDGLRLAAMSDATRWRLLRLVDLLVEIAGNEERPAANNETAGGEPAASREVA